MARRVKWMMSVRPTWGAAICAWGKDVENRTVPIHRGQVGCSGEPVACLLVNSKAAPSRAELDALAARRGGKTTPRAAFHVGARGGFALGAIVGVVVFAGISDPPGHAATATPWRDMTQHGWRILSVDVFDVPIAARGHQAVLRRIASHHDARRIAAELRVRGYEADLARVVDLE